jgi:hypothetical protein
MGIYLVVFIFRQQGKFFVFSYISCQSSGKRVIFRFESVALIFWYVLFSWKWGMRKTEFMNFHDISLAL